MSLYRFKSRETGDVVMLKAHGERILEVIGKDPSGPGVIMPVQMSAAVQALRDAATAEEIEHARRKEEAAARGEVLPEFEQVSLRMRSAPFIDMLQRCEAAKVEIVWGV